jgi:hypothetical protein
MINDRVNKFGVIRDDLINDVSSVRAFLRSQKEEETRKTR